MKITGKTHVTATEKRHIKQIIDNVWMEGGTNRKFYRLTKTETGFDVLIQTPETNDWGNRIVRNSTAYVTI